jgi:hypothetical protein
MAINTCSGTSVECRSSCFLLLLILETKLSHSDKNLKHVIFLVNFTVGNHSSRHCLNCHSNGYDVMMCFVLHPCWFIRCQLRLVFSARSTPKSIKRL